MAECVIDRLEIVEVDLQQGDLLLRPIDRRKRPLQIVAEAAPVLQPRQHVVRRLVQKDDPLLLLGRAPPVTRHLAGLENAHPVRDGKNQGGKRCLVLRATQIDMRGKAALKRLLELLAVAVVTETGINVRNGGADGYGAAAKVLEFGRAVGQAVVAVVERYDLGRVGEQVGKTRFTQIGLPAPEGLIRGKRRAVGSTLRRFRTKEPC